MPISSLPLLIQQFAPISLEEMDEVKLMNRTDTKFVFHVQQLKQILREATTYYRVLEIEEHRIMTYKTLYYDTPSNDMYLAHHNAKMNRYKIRQREYVQSGLKYIEVKFKTNKDRTIKKRKKIQEFPFYLSPREQLFLKDNTPFAPEELTPMIQVFFQRITFVHLSDKERITLDTGLTYLDLQGKKHELPDIAIAEIKQEGNAESSDFKHILRKQHISSSAMSKYCVGILLTNNNIKYNRFKPLLLKLKKISHDNTLNYRSAGI